MFSVCWRGQTYLAGCTGCVGLVTNPVQAVTTQHLADGKQAAIQAVQHAGDISAYLNVLRRSDWTLQGCLGLKTCCTNPVHGSNQNRLQTATAVRAANTQNMYVHACLRVLTRSDIPYAVTYAVLVCWRCTNPVQPATTQQPADSSRQLYLKTSCPTCTRHQCPI
jgi:hypothetical protein